MAPFCGCTIVETGVGLNLPSELEELLHEMGLSHAEVRIYGYLLRHESELPSLIASATGESRGRIYQTMRVLVAKGFVQEESTRPIRFSAIPLTQVLLAAHGRLARHLEALRSPDPVFVQAPGAPAATPGPAPVRPRDVLVLVGRKACHRQLHHMLQQSKDQFWVCGGANFLRRLAGMPGLLMEAVAARARGVDARFLIVRQTGHDAILRNLVPGAEALMQEIEAEDRGILVSCVTEGASLEVVAQPDDAHPVQGDDVGVLNTGHAFVASARARLEAALKKPVTRERAAQFQWLGPDHGSDLFLEAVKDSSEEVRVLGPGDWSRYLTRSWEEMLDVYAAAKRRGVRLRAVLLEPSTGKPLGASFTEMWEIRTVSWVPVWLTLIDGQQMYQAFTPSRPNEPPQFRESSTPNEIRFYEQVFETLWDQGAPWTASTSASQSSQRSRP